MSMPAGYDHRWGQAKPGGRHQGDGRAVPVPRHQRGGGPGHRDIRRHQADCSLYGLNNHLYCLEIRP